MAYDLIKISGLPLVTPDSDQDIVVGVGDYAKRIKYADVKADMVGISPSYTTDTEPYLMRQTANIGIVGKCALDKLVGGSLGWNQLAHNFVNRSQTLGITITVDNANGSITASGTATATNNLYFMQGLSVISGHKYLVKGSKGAGTIWIPSFTDKYDSGNGMIFMSGSTSTAAQMAYGFTSGQQYSETIYPQIYDLTQMFGSTIADYVYGLGSTNGIAWLSRYIDLGTNHAYDAGSIQSVQATAHVTKDANDNVIGNYPLGSDTLRGYPMLVNNKLAFDGDEKYPDGTTRRKYNIVDLGTLTWTAVTAGGYASFRASTPSDSASGATLGGLPNIVCAKYQKGDAYFTNDKTMWVNNTSYSGTKYIIIRDDAYASSTAAQFKAAMSGVYLVYPLATETTESSTSFQKVQTIDADGTESFTTSSPVPVGHETQTPDNVLAALNWLGE